MRAAKSADIWATPPSLNCSSSRRQQQLREYGLTPWGVGMCRGLGGMHTGTPAKPDRVVDSNCNHTPDDDPKPNPFGPSQSRSSSAIRGPWSSYGKHNFSRRPTGYASFL